jgi:hypothetical protein
MDLSRKSLGGAQAHISIPWGSLVREFSESLKETIMYSYWNWIATLRFLKA